LKTYLSEYVDLYIFFYFLTDIFVMTHKMNH